MKNKGDDNLICCHKFSTELWNDMFLNGIGNYL
jgi:hypothetical protein